MPVKQVAARLIFPHQLFTAHFEAQKSTLMLLVEDDLFFKQFRFHKQKLVLHRASMQSFKDALVGQGYTVELVEPGSQTSIVRLQNVLATYCISEVSYYDLVDDWLERRLTTLLKEANITDQRLVTPGFLTTRGQIADYFENHPNRMQHFYEWQRKRLKILVNGSKPIGGKWSFDTANRKRLPKDIMLPPPYSQAENKYVAEAKSWVTKHYSDNPGYIDTFQYPITHHDAAVWLRRFITERLNLFGPYEDAIAKEHGELFHSLLSPLLNIGLLTPQQVVDEVLEYAAEHDVAIESLEGFIRQVIGWREYMRATYLQYGRQMRTANYLQFKNTLPASWWDGTVGIEPIDTVVKRVLATAYAHHIERLMVLGNSMVLLRIGPDDVYEWFMSLFIDAYDWVMVPNVYAMSQFAAGNMITTKPYISGSNYILKMSDFTGGDWTQTWDALYWQFIADHREMIEQNYRMRMVLTIYDNFDDAKRRQMRRTAKAWLA